MGNGIGRAPQFMRVIEMRVTYSQFDLKVAKFTGIRFFGQGAELAFIRDIIILEYSIGKIIKRIGSFFLQELERPPQFFIESVHEFVCGKCTGLTNERERERES